MYRVDPIGEAEVNATRWIQRIQALPAPHSHQHVSVLTRDTDVALLLALHIPGRIYWHYDLESWMRVHVLRDYILNVFGSRLDLFLVLNVINGCDFFTRGDLIHQMREDVVWKVLVYSLDLRPLESYADFSMLVRRVYGVMLKRMEVRSDFHPASLNVPSWATLRQDVSRTKRYRMPKDLDQSFVEVRQVAVYWYTLQEHINQDLPLVKAMTHPWESQPLAGGVEDPIPLQTECLLPEVVLEPPHDLEEHKTPVPVVPPIHPIVAKAVAAPQKRVRFPDPMTTTTTMTGKWKKARPLVLGTVAAMSE